MYLADINICCDSNYGPIWNVVGFIVKAIWIGIPILLIIFGMIDLGKAVIASKEDEVKKATKAFGKRFLYAVLVFLVVWIVTIVLTTVSNLTAGQMDYTKSNWQQCWTRIINGVNDSKCPAQ